VALTLTAVFRLGVAELTTSEAIVTPYHLQLVLLDIVLCFV
jgi:hypothetical protein